MAGPNKPGRESFIALAWRHYMVISNEISTPKVFRCPSDITEKIVASDFTSGSLGFSNLQDRALSYFIGTESTPQRPLMHIAGDRNVFGPFGPGGFKGPCPPAEIPELDLLYPMKAYWTTTLHKKVGNMALTDGSVQRLNDSTLQTHLYNTEDPNLSNCVLKPQDEKLP